MLRLMTGSMLPSLAALLLIASPAASQTIGYLYINDNASTNSVTAFAVQENGDLVPVPGSPFPTGGNSGTPCHDMDSIAVCPDAWRVYASNQASNSISGFDILPDGSLIPIPGSPFTNSGEAATERPVGVTCDPLERLLHVANHDTGNIPVFAMGPMGQLTPVPGSPFPASDGSRTVEAHPSGDFIHVAARNSGRTHAYRVLGSEVLAHDISPSGELSVHPGSPYDRGSNACAGGMAFLPLGTPNQIPSCSPGGPYAACPGGQVIVDAGASTDPDGDPLTFVWTTTCPGATFDDPTLLQASLIMPDGISCPTGCSVTVTVSDDAGGSNACSAPVSVIDATPPALTCPPDEVIACSPSNAAALSAWAASFGATDACGVTLFPDLQPGLALAFGDFSDVSSFQFNGSAAAIHGCTPAPCDPILSAGQNVLRLTDALTQSGSVFLTNPVSLASDASFSTSFCFRILNPIGIGDGDGQGADGLVFVLQTVSNTAGGVGGGIGYQGIVNSVGIEFDTYDNGEINGNHVGIDLNGSVTSVVAVPVAPRLNDGMTWHGWVDYDGVSDMLEVRATTSPVRPAAPLLSLNVDLVAVLGTTNAFAGFTSGTGGGGGTHEITCWDMDRTYDPVLCGQEQAWTMFFTAVDGCGNESSCVRTFLTEDTSPPVLDTPASSLSVECDGAGNAAQLSAWLAGNGGASAIDGCGDVTWSHDFTGISNGCGATGMASVTFTATDECGNSASTVASFTIVDAAPPILVGVPADLDVECGVLDPPPIVTATDGCGSATVTFIETTILMASGCSDGQREGYLDLDAYPNIAGCSGGWSIPGVLTTLLPACAHGAGDDGANPHGIDCDVSDLCAPGWRVATTPADVLAALGGAPVVDPLMPPGLFFVSRQSGTGCGICATGLTPGCTGASCATGCLQTNVTANDIFGVGTLGVIPGATCGVLNRFSNDQCTALGAPWSCPSPGGVTEAHTVVKFGPAGGGALCVRDAGPPPCPHDRIVIRQWTATDECGNTTTAQQIITVSDTEPPAIDPPASDLQVECDGAGNLGDLIAWLASNGGAAATDGCGGLSWSHDFSGLSDGCGATGTATVTFTATDECGNAATATATFTIVDTTAPSVSPASSLEVECDGAGNTGELAAWLASNGGAAATDGCGDLSWSHDFAGLSDGCGATGTATVTFTATDECGNTASTLASFTIVDTTPPTVSAAGVAEHCLWPPNHRMVCFTAGDDLLVDVVDGCSAVTWRIVGCSSNQPENDRGDGNTAPDCAISPDGQGFCVRSERDGRDPGGRTYTIQVEAMDECGLVSLANVATIHVPHDQSPAAHDCHDAAHLGLKAKDSLPWETP